MAPEILSGAKTGADPAIDIWSLGCILFFMVFGFHPFNAPNKQHMAKMILEENVVFPKNSKVSKKCVKLIEGMLIKNYDERLTMQQISESEWIQAHYNNLYGEDDSIENFEAED